MGGIHRQAKGSRSLLRFRRRWWPMGSSPWVDDTKRKHVYIGPSKYFRIIWFQRFRTHNHNAWSGQLRKWWRYKPAKFTATSADQGSCTYYHTTETSKEVCNSFTCSTEGIFGRWNGRGRQVEKSGSCRALWFLHHASALSDNLRFMYTCTGTGLAACPTTALITSLQALQLPGQAWVSSVAISGQITSYICCECSMTNWVWMIIEGMQI